MSKKDHTPEQNSTENPSHLERYDVLHTDGSRTSGLTGTSQVKLKGLSKYKVEAVDELTPQLEQEKERAARIKNLLDSLHPGGNAPEGISFGGISLMGKDLERVRFRDNSLKNCNLRQGILRDSHWKDCDLSGADLRKADLRGCIFDSCDLRAADLRHANLSNARIIDCKLNAANFDHATLDQAVIDHCDMGAQSFHKSSCKKLKFYSSHIIHGFFDNADFTGAEIRNVLFRNCTLTNTRFQDAQLEDCMFRGCDSFHEGPVFSGSTLHKVVMMDCEFSSSRMTKTLFTQCVWERVEMDTALLDATRFNEVNFHEGIFRSCYALDKAPVFNRCRLDHTTIDQTDLTAAKFTRSSFVGATIRDSDFSDWELKHTGLDADTVVESFE